MGHKTEIFVTHTICQNETTELIDSSVTKTLNGKNYPPYIFLQA
jgi:hypothetical protein